jgi:hypothetical protein
MGACYSVTVKVNVTDMKEAVDALNHHITSDSRTSYNLEKYANIGVTTTNFDDLMRILLADIQGPVSINQNGKFRIYDNCFNASYGWESVMMEWFEVLAPFLADGSEMLIYPDSDYDKLVIRNGKCVQIH